MKHAHNVCACQHGCVAHRSPAGIGTDASIPSHINNICTRNYVNIAGGRTLVPTNLGIVLVHGYLKIDPDLVLPKVIRAGGKSSSVSTHALRHVQVRADIERQCALVADGKATKEQVVAHSLEVFAAKFKVRAVQCMRTRYLHRILTIFHALLACLCNSTSCLESRTWTAFSKSRSTS